MVSPERVELSSLAPEASTLSVELRGPAETAFANIISRRQSLWQEVGGNFFFSFSLAADSSAPPELVEGRADNQPPPLLPSFPLTRESRTVLPKTGTLPIEHSGFPLTREGRLRAVLG